MKKTKILAIFIMAIVSCFMFSNVAKAEETKDYFELGDLNQDGKINSKDAVLIKRMSAGIKDSNCVEQAGDINGDSVVNSKDAVLALRYSAGIIKEFDQTGCKHQFDFATCQKPAVCRKCNKTHGSIVEHNYKSISDVSPTCTTAGSSMKICKDCSYVKEENIPALGHDNIEATCTNPAKCKRCGVSNGSANGHSFSAATCTSAKKCSVCGVTEGVALGHSYSAATCTKAATCSRCGLTSGSPIAHSYSAATCTKAATCTSCGDIKGSPLGHSYSTATCTKAATCSRCGLTSGSPIAHSYSVATCTKAATCVICGKTSGQPLGHGSLDSNGRCKICGEYDANSFATNVAAYLVMYGTRESGSNGVAYKYSITLAGWKSTISYVPSKKAINFSGSGSNGDVNMSYRMDEGSFHSIFAYVILGYDIYGLEGKLEPSTYTKDTKLKYINVEHSGYTNYDINDIYDCADGLARLGVLSWDTLLKKMGFSSGIKGFGFLSYQ